MQLSPFGLESIDDDTLIYLFSFFLPFEILRVRKTSRRLCALSKLRIVWTNACYIHILHKGYPFQYQSFDGISTSQIERQACHTLGLVSRWMSGLTGPQRTSYINATSGTPVSEVRFLHRRMEEWILTVSKGIWDIATIWDINTDSPCKVCEWSPRGAIFSGISLNSDASSDVVIAISMLRDGQYSVELLSVRSGTDSIYTFQQVLSIESHMKPIKLQGDLLALSDDIYQTMIYNWAEGTSALLLQPRNNTEIFEHNRCIQVVFAYQSILVVRARSIHLFPKPELHEKPPTYGPLAQHSFGWIDGVSVTTLRSEPSCSHIPLSILVRSESDDPWSSSLHSLDFYRLYPDPAYGTEEMVSPYIFPPTLVTQVPAVRGSLRCRTVVLGRCGTAAWIQPQDRAIAGLTLPNNEYPLQAVRSMEAHESLVVTAFPGPLLPPDANTILPKSRLLFANTLNNWTSMDYDEDIGKAVLSSSFGSITILEL